MRIHPVSALVRAVRRRRTGGPIFPLCQIGATISARAEGAATYVDPVCAVVSCGDTRSRLGATSSPLSSLALTPPHKPRSSPLPFRGPSLGFPPCAPGGQVALLRRLFIQTQETPNPASLKFLPGCPVLPAGTAEFTSARSALRSPLAIALFRIDGVSRVFLGAEFVTVTKAEDASWDVLKPEIFAAVMDFFSSGKPVMDQTEATEEAEAAHPESEVVEMIKELLETRIRPAVQEDGGDIDFHSWDESTGVVTLRMRGACSGCPSSSVTLKSGVENMLMHYIPEVTSVEQLMEGEGEEGEGEAGSPTHTMSE